MNESDLNSRFYEIIGSMELDFEGIEEYESVTEQVLSLQATLDKELEDFGDIGEYGEQAQNTLLDGLSLYIQNKFLTLDSLSCDDEVTVSGEPTLHFMLSSLEESLPAIQPYKLHGLVQMPELKFIPVAGGVRGDRVGVFLPIKRPAIEAIDDGETRIIHLPERTVAFLSLALGSPKVERRLNGFK